MVWCKKKKKKLSQWEHDMEIKIPWSNITSREQSTQAQQRNLITDLLPATSSNHVIIDSFHWRQNKSDLLFNPTLSRTVGRKRPTNWCFQEELLLTNILVRFHSFWSCHFSFGCFRDEKVPELIRAGQLKPPKLIGLCNILTNEL